MMPQKIALPAGFKFRRFLVQGLAASLFVLFLSIATHAQEIRIAAASDLQFALPELASKFQKQTGLPVQLTFGSSGNFFSQIRNGAPFDLFFSADVEYPMQLEAAGLIAPGTLYRYATGKIVLWVLKDSRLDLAHGLSVLVDPAVHKIAIANPQHAPYGRAAVAAMRHKGVYESVKDKFVLGENISQTAQFVESGNADIGILALSIALAPALKEKGRYDEIPATFYPPIQQAVVVLKSSRNKARASRFLEFLKQPENVALMRSYGFTTPEN